MPADLRLQMNNQALEDSPVQAFRKGLAIDLFATGIVC
jgi:hypothetical protein